MGLGGQEAAGKVVTVQAELPGDVDGILDSIRRILMLGEIQSVTLRDGHPIVYQRFVRHGEELKPSESTQSFAELTPLEVVRNVQMEEWSEDSDDPQTPQQQLLWMFLDVAVRGLVVTHILMNERSTFWKWLKLPPGTHSSVNQFLGARIEFDKQLPTEVFLLCGSRSRSSTIAEISFVLKGVAHES